MMQVQIGGTQHPLFAPVRLGSNRAGLRSNPRARNHLYRTFMAWTQPNRRAFLGAERTCRA
jgi:hypothetical protein